MYSKPVEFSRLNQFESAKAQEPETLDLKPLNPKPKSQAEGIFIHYLKTWFIVDAMAGDFVSGVIPSPQY